MGGLLIIADPLHKADAVAILSGGTGSERMEEGVRIFKDNLANYYILTETGTPGPESASDISKYLKSEALRLGIPNSAILFTRQHASSTLEEAKALRDLMAEKGLHSVIVVTDPFHTFRTKLIVREVFRGRGIAVYVRPVRGHWYRSSTWWTTGRGREVTFLEYAKLIGFLAGIRSD